MQKLLVIEDSRFDMEVLSRQLDRDSNSFLAHFEEDAEAASHLVFNQAEEFNLIIADHHLPGMTGLDFCREVRGRGLDTPFILMTGGGNERIAVETIKAGANDYIIKDQSGAFAHEIIELAPKLIQKHSEQKSVQIDEISLIRELQKLQLKNRELDSFAETVAYDLKAPLSLILGFAHVLNSAEQYGIDGESLINRIIMLGTKSINIVEALLLFSKVSNQQVNMGMVNIQNVIDQAMIRLTEQIEIKDADIKINGGMPSCYGYAPWVEEIWYHLLNNAIIHGGTPPQIIVSVVVSRNRACFWISDNGPGLTYNEQLRIFDPFVRMYPNNTTGSGLGLSIVARVVERLGGEIGVRSQPGHGSSFYFALPTKPQIQIGAEREEGRPTYRFNHANSWRSD